MAAVSKAYGNFFKHLAKGEIPWKASGGVSLKVALLANTYTPNQDTNDVLYSNFNKGRLQTWQ